VPPDDFNFEVKEPSSYEMNEVKMTIKLFQPPNSQFDQNIFKSAEYWLSKGYIL